MKAQIQHYQERLAYQWDAADLFEALGGEHSLIILDTRKTAAYAREHIPQALSFPHRTMNAETTSALDKAKQYICYCDGIGCNGSTRGALKMAQLGFRVVELMGGLDWWKRDGYATEGTQGQAGTPIACAC